jgi:glycosyltransferase involved in cell wall biosynthesis
MLADVLVSVIVPTYNHEKYIEECLGGILKQKTNFNYEIIVGDDFSTDNNRAKIKSISDKYPDKFKLLFHDRNLGPAKCPGRYNSIECMNAASGKYLCWCEGDDYWTDENKLQIQTDFMEQNPDYNICFHQVSVVTENKNGTYELPADEIIPDTGTVKDLLQIGNYIHTASCFIRNSFTRNFPTWFYKMRAGDYAIYLLLSGDKKIKYLPRQMAVYRVHDAGAWGAKNPVVNYLNEIASLKVIFDYFSSYAGIIKNSIYNRYLFITDYYRKRGEAFETLKYELETLIFCIRYRLQPARNHLALALDVVKDFLAHKLKFS